MDENEIQTKYEKNKVVIKYCLENIVCKKTDHIDLFFDILNVNRWQLCLEDQRSTTNKQDKLISCNSCMK